MVRRHARLVAVWSNQSIAGMTSGTREWRIYDVGGHRSLVSTQWPLSYILLTQVLARYDYSSPSTKLVLMNLKAAWAPFFDDME